jgi:hypothetical protein
LELSTVESLDARFYYASCDSVAASGRFPAYLEQLVTVTRAREPLAVSPAEHDMKVVVSSTTAHLGKWKIAGMEEPGVQFLAFCGMFGQGLQL